MERKFNAKKTAAKKRSRKNQPYAPRTAEQYHSKPPRLQELWNRITQVISKMRAEKVSLQQASKELGVDPRTVAKRGGTALRKSGSGRYEAKKSDRLLRVLVLPAPDGLREIAVLGSGHAGQVGGYWSAVQKYLQTGNASALKKFRGKKIQDANGQEISFITDLAELNRLGSAGVFSFESIYARVA